MKLYKILIACAVLLPAAAEPLTQSQDFSLTGATFLGGSEMDDAYEPSIVVSADFSVYMSGFTASQDFPATSAAFDTTFNGGATDRFVSRFDGDLSRLSASTYLGSAGASGGFVAGGGIDLGHAVAVDGEGNVFVAGYTESPDYPTTEGGFDIEYNGGRDVVVSKFDSDLTTLLASTFVGGTGDEGYRWPRIDMAVTESGDVVVVGITHSVDFPVTEDAFDRDFNGGSESGDAFVVVLDNDLSTLRASTYLGGSHNEWRVAVHALDGGGVIVCGETESSDFPTSDNAYDRTLNVFKDAFVTRFDSRLSRLEASTFFGGSELDEALDIGVSAAGDVYITGYTESRDLPVTDGAFSRVWAGGSRDGYVAKFDSELSTLVASTLFGGSAVDMGRGLAFDSRGYVILTGNTTSRDFPTTTGSGAGDYRGGSTRGDAFLLVFDGGLSLMSYSALFGGEAEDTGFAVQAGRDGDVFIGGSTNSRDFPMVPNSFDASYNGGSNDSFLMRFSRRR